MGQFNIVAALGCLVAGTVSDAVGRRTSLMLGNLLNVIGTIIFASSHSFRSMFLGRFVMGVLPSLRRPGVCACVVLWARCFHEL